MRYDWTVEIAGDDISQWVKAGGTIDYGRRTRATAFQAPTAVFEVFTRDENPNPAPAPGTWPVIRLGDPVIIHVTWTGYTQSRRFSGIVQALDYGLYGLRVTATGALIDGPDAPTTRPYFGAADWQYRTAGETGPITNYPAAAPQTETDRVNWLCETAGLPVEIEGVPARRIRSIPTNNPGQPLLDAVLRVADDCDALLMQDRLGVMRYRTKNFARPARWTVPAHLVESTSIDMALERGTVVNQVTVYFGEPDPTTGNQYTASEQDTDSIIEYGERREDIYTDLMYELGARGRAIDYLTKNRVQWEMPDVTLVMNQATGAEADAILDLQENWRVRISPLPDGCPIAEYEADIVGFTEIMHETDYRMILHLAAPFGEENAIPEEPVFPQDSLTGGTTSTYEDQYGFLWQLHAWETPGAFTFTVNNDVTCESLVVAGGGAGGGNYGANSYDGGGGGAGALFATELPLTVGTVAGTVGAAGVTTGDIGGTGGDTTLAGIVLYGGGGGGRPNRESGDGQPGGFGGGRGSDTRPAGAGRWGTIDGVLDTTLIRGGPGNVTHGGGASYVSSITGLAVTYAVGGQANGGFTVSPGSGGRGSGFQSAPTAGQPGAVYLRYRVG